MPGVLDCLGDGPLVFGAGTRLPSGAYFPSVVYIPLQQVNVFVVYIQVLVAAKLADLRT